MRWVKVIYREDTVPIATGLVVQIEDNEQLVVLDGNRIGTDVLLKSVIYTAPGKPTFTQGADDGDGNGGVV